MLQLSKRCFAASELLAFCCQHCTAPKIGFLLCIQMLQHIIEIKWNKITYAAKYRADRKAANVIFHFWAADAIA